MIQRLEAKHRSRDLELRASVLNSPEVEQAVHNADIICSATSSTEPLFSSDWVKSGTHLNLIGSYKPTMHEIETDLVRRAHKVVVDSAEACLIEAGELIKAGLKEDDLAELGTICGGGAEHRKACEELRQVTGGKDVTIFKSVGVGAQDVMIAAAVLRKAEERGIGTVIEGYD
jgi:ornithine cyclodeaminase/alanine dehydrogenase-like protein (mu-crystallin family)